MKYAVVSIGDKQYIAREGEAIEIDHQAKSVGDDFVFENVLLVATDGDVQIGDPMLKGVKVTGTVEAQIKGPKILVFKYIPKERYRRRKGHRQRYTRVMIDDIAGDGKKKAAAAEEKPKSTRTRASSATAAKASTSKKPAAKKTTAKASTTKKTTAKKTATKKSDAKKSEGKKSEAKKSTTKKSTSKKSGGSSTDKAKAKKEE